MLRENFAWTILAASMLAGCADLTVKVVDGADHQPPGIRYALPKPVLQALPQADGTIEVDVLYLPDSSNTYAIDASSWGSSYTYQVVVGQNGLLNAVEFKEDTSAIGQQLAASAGAAGAQILNVRNAEITASQTAVNAAQSAVDTARATVDADQAQLNADIANSVTANLNSDRANLAVAQAKLQDSTAVLDRAKITSQAVTVTAATGTPVSSTGPSLGTTGFGATTWTAPTVYDLPTSSGGVLYSINDSFTDPNDPTTEQVKLVAQKLDGAAQHSFATTAVALGKTTIGPQNLTFSHSAGFIALKFSRAVSSLDGSNVTLADKPIPGLTASLNTDDKTTVKLDISKLSPGPYVLNVSFTDDRGKSVAGTVNFSVN